MVGKWFLSPDTKSGYAVVVANDALIEFGDTECKFSYIPDGNTDHGTIFHDPVHLNFVNKGYPNELDCEPHDGNDYTDVIFPHSREVSMSVLSHNNRSIVGSQIDSRKVLNPPLLVSVDAEYLGGGGVGGGVAFDLTGSLIAHYLLNNNSDDYYGGYDGTDIGAPSFGGDAAFFDGVDDGVDITVPLRFSGVKTISVWHLVKAGEVNAHVYYNHDGAGSTWYDFEDFIGSFGVNGDMHPYVAVSGNDNNVTNAGANGTGAGGNNGYTITDTGITVDDGTWHNLVIETDGKFYLRFYFDKVFIGESDLALDVVSSLNDYLFLGGYDRVGVSTSDRSYRNQTVSNVRIYSGIKTQSFIAELYSEGYYPKPLIFPTTNGLIAHYPLTGTAEDSTGNYNGTEHGVTYSNSGEFGATEYSNGYNQYILTAVPWEGTVRTYSLWGKSPGSFQYYRYLLGGSNYGTSSSSSYSWFINFWNSRIGVASATLINSPTVAFNEWHHIVVEVDHATGDYTWTFNNVLMGSSNSSHFIDNARDNIIQIGGFTGFSSGYAQSSFLSRVRIYDGGLTQQQISDIYTYEKNFRPIDIDDGLVAYYPLSDNSRDNYYNQYDGTDTAIVYDGESAVLNGTNSMITLPSGLQSRILKSDTVGHISVWVYYDGEIPAITGRTFLLGGGWSWANNNNRLYIGYNTDGYPYVAVGESTNPAVAATVVSGGIEAVGHNLLSVNYNTSTGKIEFFVNGIYIGSNTNGAFNNTGTIEWIGRVLDYDASSSRFSACDALGFRYYNKALTEEQVRMIYRTRNEEQEEGGQWEVVVPDGITSIEFSP